LDIQRIRLSKTAAAAAAANQHANNKHNLQKRQTLLAGIILKNEKTPGFTGVFEARINA